MVLPAGVRIDKAVVSQHVAVAQGYILRTTRFQQRLGRKTALVQIRSVRDALERHNLVAADDHHVLDCRIVVEIRQNDLPYRFRCVDGVLRRTG